MGAVNRNDSGIWFMEARLTRASCGLVETKPGSFARISLRVNRGESGQRSGLGC